MNCVIDNGLSQIVYCNTRYENILDLVLCNAFDNIPVADIVPPLVSSDHDCVKFDIELKYIKNSINTRIPTYTDINLLTIIITKKANFTILSNYLNSINWIVLFSQKNVNDMWITFTQKLLKAVSKYVPLYNRNSRHKRIIPKALKKLINKKMWKLACKTKNAFFIGQHADLSRKCKREINNNERFKINNLCKSNNMKNFYDFINKKIGRVKTSTIIIKSNDTHERVNNNVAVELFAKFFHSTFSIDNGKLHTTPFFCFRMSDNIIFDSNTINQLINKLPNKCSNDPDGISIFLLKKLSNSICIPIAIIFQNSFDNKSIPTQWKLADIVPIFKGKGSKYDVKNYRPISLTSTVCKLMESVIHNNISDLCNLNNILLLNNMGLGTSTPLHQYY